MRKNSIKNRLLVLALSASGCAYNTVLPDRTVVRYESNFWTPDSVIAICPVPQAPRQLPGIDPASCRMTALEFERYDREVSYYQECVEALGAEEELGVSLPERPRTFTVDSETVCRDQQAWQELREGHEKMKEHASRLERVVEDLSEALKREVVVAPKVEINPVVTLNPQANISSPGDLSLDFNRRKQGEQNYGLSMEEQAAICQGKNPAAELLGTVYFGDCVSDSQAQGTKGREDLLKKLAGALPGGGILLYCGNSSEPLASQCKPEVGDYGNLQLSWERGEGVANDHSQRLGEKLKGMTQVVYANGTNIDERSVRVYLVKK